MDWTARKRRRRKREVAAGRWEWAKLNYSLGRKWQAKREEEGTLWKKAKTMGN
jgi:hypothetical protein